MKKQTILVGVIATAMVLSIAFSGVALAAQTSLDCTVEGGSVRVQTSLWSSTEGAAPPYDETRYTYALWWLQGNSKITHQVNTDEGVEAENGVIYRPIGYGLARVFIDEGASTARVAKGDNFSVCCDSGVAARVNANAVDYWSIAAVDNNDLLFGMKSTGFGGVNIQAHEGKQIGNQNGSWTQTRSSDRLGVSGNAFYNLSYDYMSTGCDYPALAPDQKEILCPFYKP